MQQPVSFCTACLLPRLALLTPRSELRGSPCWLSECAGTRTVMTHKFDGEMRLVGASGEMPILFTLDLEGNFKSVDSSAEQLLGYSAAEMRLMNITDLVGPDFSIYLHSEIAGA